MSLKLGYALPQMKHYDLGTHIPLVARTAEQVGYDSVWVFERSLFPTPAEQGLYGVPGLAWPEHYKGVADPLISLTIAGAVTERVELGTSVLVAGLHLPFELAKALATLDNATRGRVLTGLGTGWSIDEFAASGAVPIEKRGAVLDELMDVFAAVWGPDPVSYQGEITKIAPSEVGPKPARPIPVYLAGSNKVALRRVAERADGWMPVSLGHEGMAAQWRQLQDIAATTGRERPIDVYARANVFYSAKPFEGEGRMAFQGNIDQIVEDLAAHVAAVDGLKGFLFDMTPGIHDGQELADMAGELYTAIRSAGL